MKNNEVVLPQEYILYQLVIPYPIYPVGSAAACIH